MSEFLNRAIERLKNMTPEEVLELHNRASESMEDPIFVPVDISPLDHLALTGCKESKINNE